MTKLEQIETTTTTFNMDFSIAERFGIRAIADTYKRAMEAWGENYVYLAHLVMTLNHKIWSHYEAGHERLAEVYNDLWEKAYNHGLDTLKGEELNAFWRFLD